MPAIVSGKEQSIQPGERPIDLINRREIEIVHKFAVTPDSGPPKAALYTCSRSFCKLARVYGTPAVGRTTE